MRNAARLIAMTLFWLSLPPAALWSFDSVEALLMQPARIQRSLFGEELVGAFALRSVRDECCYFPLPDGYREWTYDIPPALEARLAAPCATPLRSGLGFYETPSGSRDCIVARRDFGPGGIDGGVYARLVDGRLQLSWSRM